MNLNKNVNKLILKIIHENVNDKKKIWINIVILRTVKYQRISNKFQCISDNHIEININFLEYLFYLYS